MTSDTPPIGAVENYLVRAGNAGTEGSSGTSSWGVRSVRSCPVCGDGQLLYPDACDDGNQVDDGNGCDASCQQNNVCGNGVREAQFEECDDGDVEPLDGCSESCTIERGYWCSEDESGLTACFVTCGDGVRAVGVEACDDGNTNFGRQGM